MSSAIQQRLQIDPSLRLMARLATPQILRIDRYGLKPGTEKAVQHLQKQAALAMVRWGCPHPCLAVESLTGPKEIWRLTGYQSATEQSRVAQAMENNAGLLRELERIESQIAVLIGCPSTLLAHYTGNAHQGARWAMGRGHYLVVSPNHGETQPHGAVFQEAGGLQYGIATARTRQAAENQAAEAGPRSQVFAVRPTWGMPAPAWMRCDHSFWNSSPAAKNAAAACPVLATR